MKEHFCPVENTLITYENQCNWCGEKEESMTQEALRMALEAMESVTVECNNFHHPKRDQNHHWAKCPPVVRWDKAITAIKEALAQEQEPVVWEQLHEHIAGPFYTHPTQRTWVKLEGEEIRNLWEEATKPDRSTMTMITSFARAIEAKLKQKNGYAEEKNT